MYIAAMAKYACNLLSTLCLKLERNKVIFVKVKTWFKASSNSVHTANRLFEKHRHLPTTVCVFNSPHPSHVPPSSKSICLFLYTGWSKRAEKRSSFHLFRYIPPTVIAAMIHIDCSTTPGYYCVICFQA